MRITNAIIAAVIMIAAPFYGDIFSAIGQISVKSIVPILLTTVEGGS